jgi:hypothetical protein
MSLVPFNATLERHLETCNSVYNLIVEENRLLKLEHRAPGQSLLDRKEALLGRLDEELAAIRLWEPENDCNLDASLVERIRSRILQILHLDRENEQLLMRYSLGSPIVRARLPAPSPNQLRGLYRAS